MTTHRTEFELHTKVDEDGFVALVCADDYEGFVGEDWALDQVLRRFVANMNAGMLFVAYPGPDLANEPLRISNVRSPASALREVAGLIRVGQSGLRMTDYTQLTMAAQFRDEQPAKDYHLSVLLPLGVYRATLRQFAYGYKDKLDPAVELVLEPIEPTQITPHFEAVPWWP